MLPLSKATLLPVSDGEDRPWSSACSLPSPADLSPWCVPSFLAPLLATCAEFGPFEYLALMIFSLSCAPAGRRINREGLASAFIGLLIATVGDDMNSSTYRLTFGSNLLLQGLISWLLWWDCSHHRGPQRSIWSRSVGYPGTGRRKFGSFLPIARNYPCSTCGWRGAVVGTSLGSCPASPLGLRFHQLLPRQAVWQGEGEVRQGAIEGCACAEASNNATAMAGFIR